MNGLTGERNLLKDEVLSILERKKGVVVTGGQMANSLKVSRTAIWKAINTLQEEGNQIVAVPNVGYKLLITDDSLSKWAIRSKLTTAFVGKQLKILPVVNSTNQYLKELDATGISDGFVVIADEQEQGKGRRSRSFVSEKGEGIYLSILLKFDGRQKDIRLLTICTAVAVSKAIENICSINAGIKWVNDVFCNGKKISGILTEATLSAELQELDSVIIGIGINTGEVPKELQSIATSIQKETGKKGLRNELAAEVLNRFEEVYLDYVKKDKQQEIIDYYDSKLFIKGQQVLVLNGEKEETAMVRGIDNDGALIVENGNGDIRHLVTGEIKLKGND